MHANRRYLLPIPGNPRIYFSDFRVDYVSELIAYLCRVSSHEQGNRGNLLWQEKCLPNAIIKAGGKPHQIPSEEWSGHGEGWLLKLHAIGKQLRKLGIKKLLFHNLTRLIRSRGYINTHSVWRNAQPTEWELRDAHEAIGPDVEVMTLMNLDSTPSEIHAEMSRLGRGAKESKGGKPITNSKRYKAKWKPVAVAMTNSNPRMTLEDVAGRISYLSGRPISYVSIWNWLNGK